MASGESDRFGVLSLDLVDERARLGDDLLRLTPKAFAMLCHLAQHRDRLVTKDELLTALWPETVVGEGVLTTTIHEIRRALGEKSRGATFIQTVHRRGYRFIGPMRRVEARVSEVERRAPPIVGREDDLACCQRWFRTAERRTRRIGFIAGEAGVGKTLLLDTFLFSASSQPGVRVARGQCIELYGASEAYRPWLDAISQLCREPDDGSVVIDVLRRVAPMWLAQLPAFVSVEERRALLGELSGSPPERMLREMAEALGVLAADRPLVIALEDLHWGDRSSLELMALVAQRREPARLLVIGSYRPMEMNLAAPFLAQIKQELLIHDQCEELAIRFLSAAAVSEYVKALLPGLPEDFGSLVHRRTDGNALFMVNTLDYLARCELIVENAGSWQVRGALRAIETAVPERLQTMIQRQLSRLDADDRRLLEAASVAGVDFADATVAPALGLGVEEASTRCKSMALRGAFLGMGPEENWPDGTAARRYVFLHALYPEVLYTALPPSSRVRLHCAVGDRLETGFGQRTAEIAAELASHFERGRQPARSVPYLVVTAQNASERLAYADATRALTRALELLEELPAGIARDKQELALRMALAPALMMTLGYAAPEFEETYARAEELCRQVGEDRQFFSVLIGRSGPSLLLARTDLAKALASESLRVAESRQAPQYLTQAETALGLTLVWRGEFSSAASHLEASLLAYEAVPRRPSAFRLIHDPGVASRAYLAWAQWMLGFPDRAHNECEAAVALARDLSHPFSIAVALAFAAFVHHARRDVEATRKRAEACIAVCAEHGFAMYLAVGMMFRGWALGEDGRSDEALSVLESGLEAFAATGAVLVRPFYLSMIAEACARGGDLPRARAVVVEAIAATERTGERIHAAELHRLLGEFMAQERRAGAPSQASASEIEGRFLQALRVAREQQATSHELRAAISLARFWQGNRRSAEAGRLLRSLYARFTEGFETGDLRAAASLLEALPRESESAGAIR